MDEKEMPTQELDAKSSHPSFERAENQKINCTDATDEGLRSGEDATNTKPTPTAGAKQLKKDIIKRHSEENSNESGKCAVVNTLNGCTRKSGDDSDGSLPRADSALSNESTTSSQDSQRSQNSRRQHLGDSSVPPYKQHLKRSTNRISPASSPKATMNGMNAKSGSEQRTRKEGTPYKNNPNTNSSNQKDAKRKALTPKQIEELAAGLRKLDLAKENSLIEQFITSDFDGEESGAAVGQMLVQYSIEENRQAGKAIARIAAQLLDSGAAQCFHQGTVTALVHYFECRDRLRIDHFRVWIAFLNFVSDLYANVGYIYEGELVNLVFRIFDYLLKAPVLETLKIEELESLIGCLLSVGYDLERQCPEQLAVLKDLIRDAFVEVQEPWARKMILLLMELGASGWKLPPEANEYYFQQTNS
uniref:MIF4G domain-containing protein n=1 Tax=Ascaris lumbricoides TaxID=6252 RepID=A0A9J2PT92_ASCLU